MKAKVVTAALILGATAVVVFVLREEQSLRRALIQQGEILASSDWLQAENAELRTRILRWQAVEWELETLREQVQAVPRLRAQTLDLLRLRDENRELNLRYVQLTNELWQSVETVSAMKRLHAERWNLQQGVAREIAWADGPEVQAGTVLAELTTLDLTGLPPKPENMESFLTDESDEAAEQVIDRLRTGEQDGGSWSQFPRSRLGISSR
jgi:hypothetical protein